MLAVGTGGGGLDIFYAPKGTSGGILKSHRPSVSPSVSLSVSLSVRYKSYLSDIS